MEKSITVSSHHTVLGPKSNLCLSLESHCILNLYLSQGDFHVKNGVGRLYYLKWLFEDSIF